MFYHSRVSLTTSRITHRNITYRYRFLSAVFCRADELSQSFNTSYFCFNFGNCNFFYTPRLFSESGESICRNFPIIGLFTNSERRRHRRRSRRSYVNSPASFMMLYRTIPVLSWEHYVHPHPVNRERNASQVVILLCLRRGKT